MSTETSASFGELLRQSRLAAGLTQERLAERAGVSVRNIQNLEEGRNQPLRVTAQRLMTALDLDAATRVCFLAAAAPTPRRSARLPAASVSSVSSGASVIRPPARRPAPAGGAPPTTNLPLALTGFIGREEDTAALSALLEEEHTHLLTLTGTGGVGKTRLALQLAAALERTGRYAQGVWLVELAPLAPLAASELVPHTVAQVLGLHQDRDSYPTATDLLLATLRNWHVLLLLDNCEHLLDACAPFAERLLQSCPHLHLLATSREPLRIGGEVTWHVPSLTLPAPHTPASPESMNGAEAVRLFVQRAQAVQPRFALTAQTAPAILQICRRLDGIPLALELSAARLRGLSVEHLAAHLDQRLALLTTGQRTAPLRQQTLRATIDWSYDLLSAAEQRLFVSLSVFAGAFTLEAAQAVCMSDALGPVAESAQGPAMDPAQGPVEGRVETLDLLLRLVDKSLVLAEEDEGLEGDTRYRLLETLRQYGMERLAAAGGIQTLRQQHLRWVLALAEDAAPRLSGPEQAHWLARLEEERANVRAALAWAREHEPTVEGLRLVAALGPFWQVRDLSAEESAWVEGVVGRADVGHAATLRGRALLTAGLLAQRQGHAARAASHYQAALALLEQEDGGVDLVADVLSGLGTLTYEQGALARAAALHERSLALLCAAGDSTSASRGAALNNLAIVAANEGDFPRAITLYKEALAMHRARGNVSGAAQALDGLGWLATRRGDYAGALALHEESLALRRALGDRRLIAYALAHLGTVAAAQGDAKKAAALYAQSEALFQTIGDRRGRAWVLKDLGTLASRAGEHAQAQALHEESLVLHQAVGNVLGRAETLADAGWAAWRRSAHEQAHTLFQASLAAYRQMAARAGLVAGIEGLGAVAAARGEATDAARLLGAAAAARAALSLPLPLVDQPTHERIQQALRAVLDADFDRAWAQGRSLTLDQALVGERG